MFSIRILGFSKFGANKTCSFVDESKHLIYSGKLENKCNNYVASMLNEHQEVVSTISYSTENDTFPGSFEISINSDKFSFVYLESQDLYCERYKIELKRNSLDKGFKLISDGQIALSAFTFNIFTDHLSAKYHINIKNESLSLDFLCTICMLYFIVVYETAIYSDSTRVNHENPTPWKYI